MNTKKWIYFNIGISLLAAFGMIYFAVFEEPKRIKVVLLILLIPILAKLSKDILKLRSTT